MLFRSWFAGSLHQTASCDLVFLDPDNGVAGLRAFAEGSPKHVFLDEIRSLIGRKPRPSLVIYHHMDKTKGTAEQKTERQLKCLSKELGLSSAEQPFGVLFRPWVVRAFLILPNQDHREMLMERTNALIQKWGKDEWGKRKPKPHFTGPIPASLPGTWRWGWDYWRGIGWALFPAPGRYLHSIGYSRPSPPARTPWRASEGPEQYGR